MPPLLKPPPHRERGIRHMHAQIARPAGWRSWESDVTDSILVCLLGSFRLLQHGQPLNLCVAGKAKVLLSSLALHLESGVPRETLLDALWPEQEATQSAVSLNSLVYNIQRRVRHQSRDATPVIYANGSYFLNRDAGYTTDIVRFDTLLSAGNRLAAVGQDTDALVSYEQAVDLYRGDLCTGTDVYSVIERERLRANYLSVLGWLAEQAYRSGEYDGALQQARRLLRCDPCREDAHRIVMRAYVRRGERAQALRQYRVCEQLLRHEFDTTPEASTTALFETIRRDPANI